MKELEVIGARPRQPIGLSGGSETIDITITKALPYEAKPAYEHANLSSPRG